MIKLELADFVSLMTMMVETFDRHPVGTAMLNVFFAMSICFRAHRR